MYVWVEKKHLLNPLNVNVTIWSQCGWFSQFDVDELDWTAHSPDPKAIQRLLDQREQFVRRASSPSIDVIRSLMLWQPNGNKLLQPGATTWRVACCYAPALDRQTKSALWQVQVVSTWLIFGSLSSNKNAENGGSEGRRISDCKAHWGNVTVNLGFISKTDLIWYDLIWFDQMRCFANQIIDTFRGGLTAIQIKFLKRSGRSHRTDKRLLFRHTTTCEPMESRRRQSGWVCFLIWQLIVRRAGRWLADLLFLRWTATSPACVMTDMCSVTMATF